MIEKYLLKNYINNYSDIYSYSSDKEFINIVNKLSENVFISVNSHLIHKENKINQLEQFIFNLDNYISYIKSLVFINNLELRYILNLTIYNKYNKILFANKYYYDDMNYFKKQFQKMFMYQYLKNVEKLSIEKMNFEELINFINKNKKRTTCLFENISNKNYSFYSTIINYLFNKNI